MADRRDRRQIGRPGTYAAVAAAAMVTGALLGLMVLERERATTLLMAAAGLIAMIAWVASLVLFRRLTDARNLALRDPLTGLPNRLLLDDRIEQAVARAQRTEEPFALLAIDLDGFKEVNDVRGHEAGDEVLVATGARLESVIRGSDTVARIGGDEFVILSMGTGSEEEAALLVSRIRSELRTPFVVHSGLVELDASVGIALFPADGGSPNELLGRADSRMFLSKRSAHEPDARRRRGSLDVGIVREFETALRDGELVVHFQPIVDLATGTPVAAEALVRRVHPQRGLVTPAEFLPHLERTSVMRELTLFVLGEAYLQLARWGRLGHELEAYVNVPLRMIDDPVLAEGIAGLGEAHGISASRVTLEVAAIGNGTGADLDRDALVALKQSRVRLALDDLGRGASLIALRTLPLDEVKIDASFVKGNGSTRADDAILASLVGLAHELGMTVTAEGVESYASYEQLRALGCDRAQGFHVERPLEADAFASWLRQPWAAIA